MSAQPELISTETLITNSQSSGEDVAVSLRTSNHTGDEVVPLSTADILNHAMSSSYAFPYREQKHVENKNELTPTAVLNDYQPSAMLYIQRSG